MSSPILIDQIAMGLTQPRPLYGRTTGPAQDWLVAESFGVLVTRSEDEALDTASSRIDFAPKINRERDISYNPGPDIEYYHCPHQPHEFWYVALLVDPEQLEVVKDFYQTHTGSSRLRVRFGGVDVKDREHYPTPYNNIRTQTIRIRNPDI